ncbi:hypothetical protein D3C75_1062750 [compost metagenome]
MDVAIFEDMAFHPFAKTGIRRRQRVQALLGQAQCSVSFLVQLTEVSLILVMAVGLLPFGAQFADQSLIVPGQAAQLFQLVLQGQSDFTQFVLQLLHLGVVPLKLFSALSQVLLAVMGEGFTRLAQFVLQRVHPQGALLQ